MNVIFMGTPEFAVPALSKLLASEKHKVTAVFSQMPKPQGRGMKIHESPIHLLAKNYNDYNVPVYTPSTLRTGESLDLINSIEADVIVVAAYGFIIPKSILSAKKYGCLNIHPSKLPKYRGAAPLQRTIINGETETAVCIMQMDEGLDTGDILLSQSFSISNKTTFVELHDKCAELGADLLMQVLDDINNIKPVKQSEKCQPEEEVLYAHKLSKEESKIDWAESSFVIDCKVRGMNPWPGVYFEYYGKKIKIIEAETLGIDSNQAPGTFLDSRPDVLDISCGKGILRVIKLQPEGKRIMTASDYKRGLRHS